MHAAPRLPAFDLSSVTRRLERKGVRNATELEREFRRVAELAARGFAVAPSPVVDAYWHELILDTNLYASFCSTVVGHFLHHVPDDVEGESSETYRRTLEAYAHAFGAPSPEYWPASGSLCRDRR